MKKKITICFSIKERAKKVPLHIKIYCDLLKESGMNPNIIIDVNFKAI